MNAPPVLTAERIDAMLSVMAEVCLESVVEAGGRQKAAEDFEAFERSGRALQQACRNLRQTIAMKQRFDREAAAKAEGDRKVADAAHAEAQRVHRGAVALHRARVRRHFERVLWDEYEDSDAQELFEELDDRLGDLAQASDFLETPAATLIQRLSETIGLGDAPAPPKPPPAAVKAAAKPASPKPAAAKPAAFKPEASPTVAPPPEPPPEPPAQALPPDPPPDPPPKPYIPPWEHLRPGQIFPGGAGW